VVYLSRRPESDTLFSTLEGLSLSVQTVFLVLVKIAFEALFRLPENTENEFPGSNCTYSYGVQAECQMLAG